MPAPNVLVLVLDSTRFRNTTLGGYHRDTTPFLDVLADEATTYRQARAPAGRSLPSHASMFSGYLPQEHRVMDLTRKLAPGKSLFSKLTARGYTTGLFTDNPYLADLDTGLDDGFETIITEKDLFPEAVSPSAFVEESGSGRLGFLRHAAASDTPLRSIANGALWTLKWRAPGVVGGADVFSAGATYAERFTEWRRATDPPWAACVNLMDTHVPFRPGREYDHWTSPDTAAAYDEYDFDSIDDVEGWKYGVLENRYDGTIRQADAAVERVVGDLRTDGALDDTVVVITSDHGEGFGERSPIDDTVTAGHGDGVEEELLHVPLLVRTPGQADARSVRDPVGLVDLPEAIEAAVGGDLEPFPTDRPVFAGGFAGSTFVHVAYEPHDEDGVLKHVRRPTSDHTVHAPTPRTAYETTDAVPGWVAAEMDDVGRADVTVEASGDVDADTERRLAALGYTE